MVYSNGVDILYDETGPDSLEGIAFEVGTAELTFCISPDIESLRAEVETLNASVKLLEQRLMDLENKFHLYTFNRRPT